MANLNNFLQVDTNYTKLIQIKLSQPAVCWEAISGFRPNHQTSRQGFN